MAQVQAQHVSEAPVESAIAPEAAATSGMPQLDPAVFLPQLFWLAICFGILYYIMSRIALPRIAAVLEERRERISEDLNEATRLKDQADAAFAAYEASLAEARERARALEKEQQDRLTGEAERHRKALEETLARRIGEAEEQIAAMRDRAMMNVKAIAAEATEAILAELAGLSASREEVEQAVASAIAQGSR